MSAKTRPRQLTERDRQRIERGLAYEHQPRSVRNDEVQRVARVDENAITKAVREREAGERASTAAQIVQLITHLEEKLCEIRMMVRDVHGLDRRRYRDLDNARRALAQLKKGLGADGT